MSESERKQDTDTNIVPAGILLLINVCRRQSKAQILHLTQESKRKGGK